MKGRWPANIIHDGSEEVLELFPEGRSSGHINISKGVSGMWKFEATIALPGINTYSDKGSVARYFICCPYTEEDLYVTEDN